MVFITKMDDYQKHLWHKQECDSNGHDYKGGLLYMLLRINNFFEIIYF